MSVAVAVFVKTPEVSPLKTRLAATIGEEKAVEFYTLSVQAIEETLCQIDVTPYWAVAEDEALEYSMWKGFQALATGEGDLGARQNHVYEMLLRDHEKVILIGADAPQLSSDVFDQAIAALDENDFVIGPAHDGGYYLFGGRVSIERKIWGQVPWSSETTRDVFESLLPSKPVHLKFFTDVDVQEDLKTLVQEMPTKMNEVQLKIVDWVSTL